MLITYRARHINYTLHNSSLDRLSAGYNSVIRSYYNFLTLAIRLCRAIIINITAFITLLSFRAAKVGRGIM
jgi:hypothetical protein